MIYWMRRADISAEYKVAKKIMRILCAFPYCIFAAEPLLIYLSINLIDANLISAANMERPSPVQTNASLRSADASRPESGDTNDWARFNSADTVKRPLPLILETALFVDALLLQKLKRQYRSQRALMTYVTELFARVQRYFDDESLANGRITLEIRVKRVIFDANQMAPRIDEGNAYLLHFCNETQRKLISIIGTQDWDVLLGLIG